VKLLSCAKSRLRVAIGKYRNFKNEAGFDCSPDSPINGGACAESVNNPALCSQQIGLPFNQKTDHPWMPVQRRKRLSGKFFMRVNHLLRTCLVALVALTGVSASTIAHAGSGTIRISVVKGGWFIGASGGSGSLTFRGRRYALSIGGLSGGLVFGASKTELHGRVSHIRRPSDVSGVYGAIGAGAVVGYGARALVLKNEKGAVLTLSGHQVGLMGNADLSGLAISLR
jgi:hypothetical protein